MTENQKTLAEIDAVIQGTRFTHHLNEGENREKYGERFGHLAVTVEIPESSGGGRFDILMPQKYAGEIKPGEAVRVSIARR